jgi:hypothetical protein
MQISMVAIRAILQFVLLGYSVNIGPERIL